jgi:hypothetical protein
MENDKPVPILEYAAAGRVTSRWLWCIGVALLAFSYGFLAVCWGYTLCSDLRHEVFAAEWGNHGPWQHFSFAEDIGPWSALSSLLAAIVGVCEMRRSLRAGAVLVALAIVYWAVLLLHLPMVD